MDGVVYIGFINRPILKRFFRSVHIVVKVRKQFVNAGNIVQTVNENQINSSLPLLRLLWNF